MSQAETPGLEEEEEEGFCFFYFFAPATLQGHKTFMHITAEFMCSNKTPLLQKVMSERAPTLLQLERGKKRKKKFKQPDS